MASTYELVASQTLGSSAAYIDFTGIASTWDDLVIVGSARTSRNSVFDEMKVRFNGAASDANMSARFLEGTGSSAVSNSMSYGYMGATTAALATADTFNSFELYVPNYAGSTNKSYTATVAHETNATTAYIDAIAGLWASTSTITQIRLLTVTAQMVTGSSFQLYGVSHA